MDSAPSSFEQALEADIKTLAAEIHRSEQLKGVKNVEGVDAVREAIKAFPAIDHGNDRAEDNGVPAARIAGEDTASPLPAYAQNAAPEVRLEIEYLLDVALHKGIAAAMAASEKSPYFVQDAFHDALAGRLYPELQRRGIVK